MHKPKKFQTKVFSVIYLHKFKMIFTAFLNFGQESKNAFKLWNVPTETGN